MDPLSITASALTLIHVTGIVATTLARFARSVQTADTHIKGLNDELNSLNLVLNAIRGAFSQCHDFSPELFDDGLWQQSDLVMRSCHTTLDNLNILVNSIKKPHRFSPYAWRLRVALDLQVHSDDLVTYREKIHRSCSSLRTILHTITVTLALRTSVSQHLILQELQILRASVNGVFPSTPRRLANVDNIKAGCLDLEHHFPRRHSSSTTSLSNFTDASTLMEEKDPRHNKNTVLNDSGESVMRFIDKAAYDMPVCSSETVAEADTTQSRKTPTVTKSRRKWRLRTTFRVGRLRDSFR